MSHGMRGIAFFQKHSGMSCSCKGDIFFVNLFNTGNGHLWMCLAGKDISFQLSSTSSFFQIPFQKNPTGFGNHNSACFVPFSCNRKLIQVFLYKKVSNLKVTDFLCPCSTGVHQV